MAGKGLAQALIEVEQLLHRVDKSVSDFGMAAPALPPPQRPHATEDELSYDPEHQQEIVRKFLSVGNA